MSTKANDLVNPITYKDEYGCTCVEPSLTKLEYFAARAMQGYCSTSVDKTVIISRAKLAVEQAKALIEALNEGE